MEQYSQYFGGLPQLQLAENLRLTLDWTPCTLEDIEPKLVPVVIIFRPQKRQQRIGCVRVSHRESSLLLWDVYSSGRLPATRVYTGIIRPGCDCALQNVEIKLMKIVT